MRDENASPQQPTSADQPLGGEAASVSALLQAYLAADPPTGNQSQDENSPPQQAAASQRPGGQGASKTTQPQAHMAAVQPGGPGPRGGSVSPHQRMTADHPPKGQAVSESILSQGCTAAVRGGAGQERSEKGPPIVSTSALVAEKSVEAVSELGDYGQWVSRRKRSSRAKARTFTPPEVPVGIEIGPEKRKRAPKKDAVYEYE